MATFAEVLAQGATPSKINATIKRLSDPETGKQFIISLKVPDIATYCDILDVYRGQPYLKQCIGVIDACLIDPDGIFTSKPLEDRCDDGEFEVTRMKIIGKVLRSEEIIKISLAIDDAVMAGETRTPDEIIEELTGEPQTNSQQRRRKKGKGSRRRLITPDEILAERIKN